MRTLLLPNYAAIGILEPEEDDEIKEIGIYTIKFLKDIVDILCKLRDYDTESVKIAIATHPSGFNSLLFRPPDRPGDGWLALAPEG